MSNKSSLNLPPSLNTFYFLLFFVLTKSIDNLCELCRLSGRHHSNHYVIFKAISSQTDIRVHNIPFHAMCSTGNWFKTQVAVNYKCWKINLLWWIMSFFSLLFFFFAKGLAGGGGRVLIAGYRRLTPQYFPHVPFRKFPLRCIVGQEERRLSWRHMVLILSVSSQNDKKQHFSEAD